MKYTIHGFSQNKAMQLGLDHDDLLILRYFVDFKDSGSMAKEYMDDDMYYWVNYETLRNDLPILNISKDRIYRKLKALAKIGVLKHKTKKKGGTFAFYALGENYASLIRAPLKIPEGYGENTGTPTVKIPEGYGENTGTKDSSTKDSSTKKSNKKEGKKSTTYDEVINAYTINTELKDTLIEFIKMRKLIKSPLTDRALQLLLSNLDKLADNDTKKVAILEQSIMNNWKSVYALKGDARSNGSTGQNNAAGKAKWDGYEPSKPKSAGADDSGLI